MLLNVFFQDEMFRVFRKKFTTKVMKKMRKIIFHYSKNILNILEINRLNYIPRTSPHSYSYFLNKLYFIAILLEHLLKYWVVLLLRTCPSIF